MSNFQFTVEEENLICIYHNADRRRTITAIADALPYGQQYANAFRTGP